MNDWKFATLLQTFSEHTEWCEPDARKDRYFNDPGQLWFAYPWTFGDRLEGSLPDANQHPEEYCDRMATLQKLSPEEAARRKHHFLAADTATLKQCVLSMAQICGVTCWHSNSDESADMWREFVPEQNGVAIRTTVGQLEHALGYAHNSPVRKAQPTVCAVGYVDHSTYFLPADGYRNLLGIIRSDYSYENEVRFVTKSPYLAKIPTTIKRQLPQDPAEWSSAFGKLSKEEKEEFVKDVGDGCAAAYTSIRGNKLKGFNLPINLDGMINAVVLKSGCKSDYRTEVE
jgi:hypothetical protein